MTVTNMGSVSLVWATPDGDALIARMARVSAPHNENNVETMPRLLRYLIKHGHWSPFEMVCACVQIDDISRTIGRQLLRHWSFRFQEFSQRYAETTILEPKEYPSIRVKGGSNRQGGVAPSTDSERTIAETAKSLIEIHLDQTLNLYWTLLATGVAKETARSILPEGYTKTRMYMQGNLRSWMHYLDLRTRPDTQEEHRMLALRIKDCLHGAFPVTFQALEAVNAGE